MTRSLIDIDIAGANTSGGGGLAPINGARGYVYKYGTTTPISDSLYAGPTGGSPISNPLTSVNGRFIAWVDTDPPGTDVPGNITFTWDDNSGGATPPGSSGTLTYEVRKPAGPFTGNPDYVIYIDGAGTYRAESQTTGITSVSGTDVGSLVNTCIANLAANGKGHIGVKPGVYNQATSIDFQNGSAVPYNSIRITGMGPHTPWITNSDSTSRGAIFQATSGLTTIMVNARGYSDASDAYKNLQNVTLENLTFDGNSHAATGLRIWDAQDIRVDFCLIKNCTTYGTLLGVTTNNDTCYNISSRQTMWFANATGMSSNGSSADHGPFLTLYDPSFRMNTTCAIDFNTGGSGVEHLRVFGGHILNPTESGTAAVDLDDFGMVTIIGVNFENNNGMDIHAGTSGNNATLNVIGNTFTNSYPPTHPVRTYSTHIEKCKNGIYEGNSVSFNANDNSSMVGFQLDNVNGTSYTFNPDSNFFGPLSGSQLPYVTSVAGYHTFGTVNCSSGGSITPSTKFGRYQAVVCTGNNAGGDVLTVNAPLYPLTGFRLTLDIKNSTTAGTFSITWNGAFLESGAAPAVNKRATYSFYYDGTNWVQDGTKGPDL
jgi:hypothetical protein